MTTDLIPASSEEDDFWDDAPAPSEYGIKNGRYVFPDPPGYVRPPRARGFMRMTNLASAFSDQVRLQKWRERMLLIGMRADEGVLFDELAAQGLEVMDPVDAKAWLEEHADKAVKRAGGDAGARRGTARHLMVQLWLETGILTGHRTMRLQLASLQDALARHYLKPITGWSERRVCNPEFHTIGTLDMAVECQLTGRRGILDLKTQRAFWSYLEICGQQAGYDSAPWYWDGPEDSRGSWARSPAWDLVGVEGGLFPGRRVALLAHMPQEPGPGQLPVEIHEVDLSFGREVLKCAAENVRLRSIGASRSALRAVGGLRPVPRIQATVGLASDAIAE